MSKSRKYVQGQPVYQMSIKVREPITGDVKIHVQANAIIIQNMGNTNIILEGGFTIAPSGNLMLGSWENVSLITQELHIRFGRDDTVNKCEIIEVHLHDPQIAHYEVIENMR